MHDDLTAGDLDLLRSYAGGPRIWDAASILPAVYRLAGEGLIEPALTDLGDGPEDRGAYQLTGAGRTVMEEADRG